MTGTGAVCLLYTRCRKELTLMHRLLIDVNSEYTAFAMLDHTVQCL